MVMKGEKERKGEGWMERRGKRDGDGEVTRLLVGKEKAGELRKWAGGQVFKGKREALGRFADFM